MAFTTDQYNALTEAIAQGALMVKYADKEVTYRSMDDMIRIKTLMEKDLGLIKTAGPVSKVASFTKGINGTYINRPEEGYLI